MSDEIFKAVEDLLQDGYAYISIDTLAVMNAQRAAEKLLRSIDDNQNWSVSRSGENEADLGRVCKSKKQGFDEKIYFHYAIDLVLRAPPATRQQKACLKLVDILYHRLKGLSSNIVTELSRRGVLPVGCGMEVLETFRIAEAYNTSVLRFLHYPDVPGQNGARAHYDKSLLTIHLGDEGGELYVQNQAGGWEEVSPPQGMALVFFGVKALYLSRGKLTPLLHKSTTVSGKARTAVVLFAHADTGFPVYDAQKVFEEYTAVSGV